MFRLGFRLLRFAIRWFVRVLVLVILAGAALVVFRDTLLRELLSRRIERVTGLGTHLGGVETRFDRAAPALTLTDVVLTNTPDFGGTPMLVLPELRLELDADALRYRELRLRTARVRIDLFSVVRNQRGETNVFAVLGGMNERATPGDAAVVSPPGLEFTGVETLDLSFGTLRLIDLGQPANNRELRVALTNEILHQVKSAADFTPLVLRVLVREVSAGLKSGLAPAAPR